MNLQANLACGTLLRVYFCLHILTVSGLAMFDERTLVARLVLSAGNWGIGNAIYLCVLAAIGLVDAIVNDILPDRFHFRRGLEYRHVLFMGLAVGFACYLWFAVQLKAYLAIPYYCLQIGALVVSAFLDVHLRSLAGWRARNSPPNRTRHGC